MIKIAIPNKGRLFEPTMNLLKKAGYEPKEFTKRKLTLEINSGKLKIYFIRTDEIGFYVESGIVDLGITGIDLVVENGYDIKKILDFNYGKCNLVLAGPKNKKLTDNITIATKYTNISKRYLKQRNITAKLIKSPGATEIKPQLGIADFIIDITSTGTTLKNNNLTILDSLLESNAALVGNKKSLSAKKKEIEDIKLALKSVILAENKSYLIFNISKEILKRILDQIPCMRAPTIVNTGNKNIVSVQTVVPTIDVSKIITKLKKIGTTDILVLDIERVVV